MRLKILSNVRLCFLTRVQHFHSFSLLLKFSNLNGVSIVVLVGVEVAAAEAPTPPTGVAGAWLGSPLELLLLPSETPGDKSNVGKLALFG